MYTEIGASAGLALVEEIEMQLLKSSVSRARPRAKEEYLESVLVSRKCPACTFAVPETEEVKMIRRKVVA